jgi:Domain of unknown function (DUF4352)
MALIKCRECGREISSKSATCPGCGAPVKAKSSCFAGGCLAVVAVIGIFVLIGMLSNLSKKSSSTGSFAGASATPAQYKLRDTTANAVTAATAQPRTEGKKRIYTTGEPFRVGYTAYKVNDSWYTKRLSGNQFLNQPPDATYLFVDVSVLNTDKKQRMIPPFKLLDENNAEYGTSDKAWMAEGSIGLLQNLNPGVGKRAYVIFDVPTRHTYRLRVSGGYWSADEALVELAPHAKSR